MDLTLLRRNLAFDCVRCASSLPSSSEAIKLNMASNPTVSTRVLATDIPIMVKMTQLLKGKTDVLSLGQGIVYWEPPASALRVAQDSAVDPKCHGYGADDGTIELRDALVEKVKTENKLLNSSIMVTAGANQAFTNIVIAICDPGDAVVLFEPYYFNHKMAFQMTGVNDFLYGKCDELTLSPNTEWLENAFLGNLGNNTVPKVVVICNPCNPTGVVLPLSTLEEISNLCEKFGSWLILDNTYEYFVYDGNKHYCLEGDHIINLFSFSKAYGMMGWRVGYIAYPTNVPNLSMSLLKVQDTIPICANLVAQRTALTALTEGPEWVHSRVLTLLKNREIARESMACLGKDAVKGGEGAIYLWAKLPEGFGDDVAVVEWLISRHGVAVIPGSVSGVKGCIRVAFGNLDEQKYREASLRLKKGLEELMEKGMV